MIFGKMLQKMLKTMMHIIKLKKFETKDKSTFALPVHFKIFKTKILVKTKSLNFLKQ